MKKSVFVIIVFSALLFTCQNPVQQSGGIILRFDMQESRLIQPDFDMVPESYVISGNGPGSAEFEITTDDNPAEIHHLVFGEWLIHVYARNEDGIIIAETDITVTVHAGMVTEATATVTPLDGTGSLDLTVTWNGDDTDSPSIEATLVPASLPEMVLPFTITGGDTGTYFSNMIPTGYHTVIIKLMDGPEDNRLLAIGVVDVVRIIKDQVSCGTFDFPEINKQGGTISILIEADMEDPIDIVMAGQVEEIYEGQSFTVTASAPSETGSIVYAWYINGDVYETGASCEVHDLDPGIYYLDVTAFTADGTRAGAAHHVFSVAEFDTTYISQFVWSPDSSKIAFVKCPEGNAWNNELWVADNDFHHPECIKTGVYAYGLGGWQGNRILFMKDYEEGLPPSYYGSGEIFSIGPDGTGEVQVTYTYTNGIRTEFWNSSYNNIGTAVWSSFIPGTDRIYFHANDGNGWYRTYACNADGTDNWYNVSYPYYTWRPAKSPAGNKLYFASSSNFNTAMTIQSVNINGSGAFAVKGPLPQLGYTVLSDENHIAWALDDLIYVINTDGTGERTVLDDVYTNYISGTGRYADEVLISSNRLDGNFHIFKLNIDSGLPLALTYGDYNDSAPAYSPDGTLFAYLRLPADYSGTGVPPYELMIKPAE